MSVQLRAALLVTFGHVPLTWEERGSKRRRDGGGVRGVAAADPRRARARRLDAVVTNGQKAAAARSVSATAAHAGTQGIVHGNMH